MASNIYFLGLFCFFLRKLSNPRLIDISIFLNLVEKLHSRIVKLASL